MEQRRLRVGDTVDDYCPRERRVTNHAIVAMIEDEIRQTRCTTCDAEHPFKGGSAPRRRRKGAPDALYNEVLSGMSDQQDTRVSTTPPRCPRTSRLTCPRFQPPMRPPGCPAAR